MNTSDIREIMLEDKDYNRYIVQKDYEEKRAEHFADLGNNALALLLSRHVLSCYWSVFVLSKDGNKLWYAYQPGIDNVVGYHMPYSYIDVTECIGKAISHYYGLGDMSLGSLLQQLTEDGHQDTVKALETYISEAVFDFANGEGIVEVYIEKTVEETMAEVNMALMQ